MDPMVLIFALQGTKILQALKGISLPEVGSGLLSGLLLTLLLAGISWGRSRAGFTKPLRNAQRQEYAAKELAHLRQHDQAFGLYMQALDIYDQAGKRREVARVCKELADIYTHKKDWEQSISYRTRGITLLKELKEDRELDEEKIQLAQTLRNSGNLIGALTSLEDSIEFQEKIENNPKLSVSYKVAAAVCNELDRRRDSITYYKKALRVQEHLNDLRGVGLTSCNLARLSVEVGESKAALDYFDAGVKNLEKAGEYGTAQSVRKEMEAIR